MKTQWLFGVLFILLMGLSAGANQFRVWTDKNGKTISAEHVRTADGKVTLHQEDGTEIKIPLDTLSEKDRHFAMLQQPPRIEIEASAKTDRTNRGVGPDRGPGIQIQHESVIVKVALNKSSSAPYELPLVASVVVIGAPENGEGYVILDRTVSSFSFSTDNRNNHEFTSEQVTLRQFEAGEEHGIGYVGYLVSVTDESGDVLATKGSKIDFEQYAEVIRSAKKKDRFNEDFVPVEAKQKRFKEGNKPNVPWRKPGRTL